MRDVGAAVNDGAERFEEGDEDAGGWGDVTNARDIPWAERVSSG